MIGRFGAPGSGLDLVSYGLLHFPSGTAAVLAEKAQAAAGKCMGLLLAACADCFCVIYRNRATEMREGGRGVWGEGN